jgi:hypothetical protein
MMLRESDPNNELDMEAAIGEGKSVGGAEADLLTGFVDAVLGDAQVESVCKGVVEAMGEAALVDAVAVIANFDAITKIADGTGIELDTMMASATESLREELGINRLNRAES